MTTATGCPQLDQMLNGGIPDERAVLITGGPGVGKSTLAMQFLQEGLDSGEQCLYVSTEQTTEELRSSFAPFDFDLDHPDLTITSIHATPSTTIEESESGMALQTLHGDDTIDGPFTYPFEGEYVIEFLQNYAPCDRVVLDSVSGLGVISEDRNRFRRVVLDLIRLFTDTYRATTVFTAEETASSSNPSLGGGTSDLLQFTTNGVVRLWWGELRGSRRRFLQVVKMRGVDHDTRNFEIGFDTDGIYLTPTGRTSGIGTTDEAVISTQVQGLDDLSGGLVRGHSVLLEYDGRAMVDGIVAQFLHAAWTADMCSWLITSPTMRPQRVRALLPKAWDLQSMLDDDRLFVMDMFSAWDRYHDHRNVFYAPSGILGSLFRRSPTVSFLLEKKVAETIDNRRGDTSMFGVAYTEALLRWLEPDDVKESYYWSRERLAGEFDTGLFIHNPATMPESLSEFFYSDSVQVFEATMAESGIQYLHLNKSPVGEPGSTSVIDYTEDGLVVKKRR